MASEVIDWPEVPVSKIADIILGGTPKTSEPKFWNGDIKWATAKDISNCATKHIKETEKKITRLGLQKSNAKLLQKGTIVITARGTVGEIRVLGEPMAFNQTCYAVVPKRADLIDSDFLYYALRYAIDQMRALSYGTVFETITTTTFDDLTIPLPPLLEQRKIAEIIGSLDDKIELNYEMNKTLEAIAQAIFKNWFVDFEPFKDELVYNEELDREIPKGWEVGILEDVLSEIESGLRPPGGVSNIKYGVPSIGAEHIIGLGKFNYSETKYVPQEFYEKMKRGKVRNEDVLLYKDGAYIGRKTYFDYGFPFEKCCVNEHVFILRTNKLITPRYLYFWLDQKWITNLIINMSLTSAQPGLNQQSLKTVPILIPRSDIVKRFDELVKPCIMLLFTNAKESHILEQIRDALLPKLLSGEIRVKVDVEKEFPEETRKLEEIKEEKIKFQESLDKWFK